nr:PREDICTED: uncharacterized protein LOC108953586 [Musa acuminata subsp. malaccensis]
MKFESRFEPVMRRDLGGSADRAALLRSTPPGSRWLLILPAFLEPSFPILRWTTSPRMMGEDRNQCLNHVLHDEESAPSAKTRADSYSHATPRGGVALFDFDT